MERKIVEYYIASANSAEGLTKLVNEHLKQGWELHSDFVACQGVHFTAYNQAMVKYEQKSGKVAVVPIKGV